MTTKKRMEIGYLCSRGHFVFYGGEDDGACSSKRIGAVIVETDHPEEEVFYPPSQYSDEYGSYSISGYSAEEWESDVAEAATNLKEGLWRRG